MRKNRLKIIMIGMIFLLGLSACGGNSPQSPDLSTKLVELKPITVQLNWVHGPGFTGFYTAQANGYYAEEGLDVTLIELGEISKSVTNLVRVEQGELDFGVGGFGLIRAQANGTKLTAVANIYKLSPNVFFARTDTGIQTPADLAGFRIVVKNQGWQDLLEDLLDQGGLTLDDIVPVEGGFDMTPFLEGDVDVWSDF